MPLDQYDEHAEADSQMSFLDHLELLRWHVIRSVIVILVFSVLAFANKDFLFGVLIMGPAKPDFFTYQLFCKIAQEYHIQDLCIDKLNFTLQSREMTGQFMMHITSSFIAGFVCAFPYVFWEIWRFVKPGLYQTEKNSTRGAVFFVSLLFAIGVLFGYYVVSPLSINFLANYQLDPTILNQFDITSYISTLVGMVLACGLMFQLPMIIFVLTKLDMITPKFMRTYRKHAFILILVIAAFITPSPDIFSMLLVGIPLYGLYEGSIFISAYEYRRKQKLAKTE